MQRTPPATPNRNNLIKESMLKLNNDPITPADKKRKFSTEMSPTSGNRNESNSSEMMMQRLESLESQLTTLNNTITSLNAIINDLRSENCELKKLLKKIITQSMASSISRQNISRANIR